MLWENVELGRSFDGRTTRDGCGTIVLRLLCGTGELIRVEIIE